MSLENNKYIKLLEKYDGREMSTKELKSLGLSPYFIKKLTELKCLEKKSRGEYLVRANDRFSEENEEYIQKLIIEFKNQVHEKNFQEAYITLVHMYEDKKTNTFDTFIKLCFILIKNILGKNYDYSYADNIKLNNESMQDHEKYIACQNFFKAVEAFKELEEKEKQAPLGGRQEIFIYADLVNEIVDSINNGKNTELRKQEYTYYYTLYYNLVLKRRHFEAINYLNKAFEYCDNSAELSKLNLLKEVTNTMLEAIGNRKNVSLRNTSYKESSNLVKELTDAVYHHDFFYALYLLEEYTIFDNKKYKHLEHLITGLLRLTGEYKEYSEFKENFAYENEEEKVIAGVPEKEVKNNVDEVNKIEKKEDNVDKKDEPVVKVKENPKQFVEKVESSQMQYNNELRVRNYNYTWFLSYFNNGMYNDAIYYLEKIISEDKESNENKIYDLLSSYLAMKKDKEGFKQYNYNYDGLSTLELFNQALLNHDYKTALKNIGKLTYQNNDEYLNILKTILHNMYELDKMYGKKEEKTQEKENNTQEEYVPYSYTDLAHKIQNLEFDEVYNNLAIGLHERKLNRLELNTFRLLEILNHLKEGRLKVINEEIIDDGNYFRCFYEAIRYHQVDKIVYYLYKVYDRAQDKSELDVLGIIIGKINEENEVFKERLEAEEREKEEELRLKNITKETNASIKNLLNHKNELSFEEIDNLYNLLERKEESDIEAFKLESCILVMIDTIMSSQEIDANYFADLRRSTTLSNENDISLEIDYLLENGDYINAFNLIFATPFNKCLLKYSIDNRMIIRNLLSIFVNTLNKKKEITKKSIDQGSVELKAIQSRIKHNDFLGAFENILASTHLDSKILTELSSGVLTSYIGNSIMERSAYEDYENAFNNQDLNEMRISLINYKEILDKSSYGKVEEYKNKYQDMSLTYEEEKKKLKK